MLQAQAILEQVIPLPNVGLCTDLSSMLESDQPDYTPLLFGI